MPDDDSESTSNVPNSPSPSLEQSLCDFESFEYYEDESAFRAIYSRDVASPSLAVISAVAAVSDTDPLDLDPLHTTVDTDALDSLVTPRRGDLGDVHITFDYHGCEVTATSYGSLRVEPLQSRTSSPSADDR